MKKALKRTGLLILIMFIVGLAACSDKVNAEPKKVAAAESIELVKLDIFKSSSCTCCGRWVSHIESNRFDTATHHPNDLNNIKVKLGIAPQYQSCHTGVSKEG